MSEPMRPDDGKEPDTSRRFKARMHEWTGPSLRQRRRRRAALERQAAKAAAKTTSTSN